MNDETRSEYAPDGALRCHPGWAHEERYADRCTESGEAGSGKHIVAGIHTLNAAGRCEANVCLVGI